MVAGVAALTDASASNRISKMTATKRKVGRPASGTKTDVLFVRVSEETYKEYQAAADRLGETLSTWARLTLNRAVREERGK